MKSKILMTLASLAIAAPISIASADSQDDTFPGIEHVTSQASSIAEVESRLKDALEAKGLTLFTVIDHTQNAEKVDMQLPPTRTVIFGNPKVGTPLMKCQGSTALDLPQKMVLRETDEGTRIEWNAPAYLAERHGLQKCDLPLNKIGKILEDVAETAAGT